MSDSILTNALLKRDEIEVLEILWDEKDGDLLLGRAAELGAIKTVGWLLAKGIDPNTITGFPKTNAIIKAAENGHAEVLKLLVKGGARVTEGPPGAFLRACAKNHTEALRILMQAAPTAWLQKTAGSTKRGHAAGNTRLGQAAVAELASRQRKECAAIREQTPDLEP